MALNVLCKVNDRVEILEIKKIDIISSGKQSAIRLIDADNIFYTMLFDPTWNISNDYAVQNSLIIRLFSDIQDNKLNLLACIKNLNLRNQGEYVGPLSGYEIFN